MISKRSQAVTNTGTQMWTTLEAVAIKSSTPLNQNGLYSLEIHLAKDQTSDKTLEKAVEKNTRLFR